MNRHLKKGSALLVVLGFLSFMVVSAVAFAIWMRTERLPSSALRRTVANRYLVKAALAQAMSRVDDAIRSHVFPGAWHTNDTRNGTTQVGVYRDANDCAYDWWESRVFMPPDPEGLGTKPNDQNSRYAPYTKTVSVLNFEALGYLPPAIANDVRFLSRSSWAAQWDYFNFDAGRYAFCAVNVSDFLDINKMAADAPRTSAAAVHPQSSGAKPPPSRFSLAYLFRSSTTPQSDDFSSPSGMDTFDNRVHTSRREWTTAPLVSLMDYNLSIGGQGHGNIWSPFYDLAGGVNDTPFFYEAAVPASPYVRGAERQPFVTDSWFPPSDLLKSDGTANTPLDISRNLCAPFSLSLLKNDSADLSMVLADTSPLEFWKTMYQNGHAFCMLDQFTLFDYLDENDVPISLAMPCAERVPMITALAPVPLRSSPNFVEFTPMAAVGSPEQDTAKMEWRETSEANIKINAAGLGLRSTLIFPFSGGKTPVACSVQAFARLVFVASTPAGGAGGATPATAVSLRNNGFATNFRPWNEAEWTASLTKNDQFKLGEGSSASGLSRNPVSDCLLITLPGTSVSWTPPATIALEQDSWNDMLLPFQDVAPDIQTTGIPIIRKVDVYELVPSTAPGGTPTKGPLKDTYYQVLLNPFDASGMVIDVKKASEGNGLGIPAAAFTALAATYTLQPYLVTWVRVVQDGKTVDMVPATYEDDTVYNSIQNAMFNFPIINDYFLGNTPSDLSGSHALPIMRFQNEMSFTYAAVMTPSWAPPTINWVEKSCWTIDPRYNWAPENWWFDANNSNPKGETWCEAVFGNPFNDPVRRRTNPNGVLNMLVQDEFQNSVDDRGDRANDLFLFVSNLGYLQSVGELAFLPHLSDMKEDGLPTSVLGDTWNNVQANVRSGALYNGNPRMMNTATPNQATLASMPCALAAWKSYQSFRTNTREGTFEFGANLYRRGLVNGSQGFYVNPFTQSQEIMLAALANTPLNYWVAGTNYTAMGKSMMGTFNSYKNFTFDNSPVGVRPTGRDMNKIATFLRHRFEDLASMIEIPPTLGGRNLIIYQKVWEDMFDALDWSGSLDCTVGEVYQDLQGYYFTTARSANDDYRRQYSGETGKNGFPDLNHVFMLGGSDKDGIMTSIRLNPEKAVYKNEFALSADPLRGQIAGDTVDTTCYQDFFDVDRMFLHSYWRDCFANRQQLFLIFVRAESTALGGAGEGTPAQQGGRAVALVWRDPFRPTDSQDIDEEDVHSRYDRRNPLQRHPHKMRILFYRQFD